MKRTLFALFCATVVATPAAAAQVTATATVNVNKPVQLMKLQDMDFGTLTLSGFTGTRSIVMSRTGVVTCATNIVCAGATKAAGFNVQGSNRMVVNVTVPNASLSNGIDSIPFAPDVQSTITLTSSGVPGVDFYVGGTLTVSPTLAGGTYTGTVTVTADYQ